MKNYLTEDEIALDLYKNMNFQNRIIFSEQDSLMHRHGLGLFIRTIYGLWDKENPYTYIGCEDSHVLHPDQVSDRIIKKLQNLIKIEADTANF